MILLNTGNQSSVIGHLSQFLREDGTLAVFKIISAAENLEQHALQAQRFLALGEHAITTELFKAVSQLHKDAGIVAIDAHADGSVRKLVESQLLSPQKLIIIGLRSYSSEELSFLRLNNVRVYAMKNVHEVGIIDVMDAVMEQALQWGAVYVSVNIAAIDPAFAPGVNQSFPGGMSSREVIYAVQRLKLMRNFAAGDVVNVPQNDVTARLAAKLLIELS